MSLFNKIKKAGEVEAKTIIIVSENGIRSVKVNPFFQILVLILFISLSSFVTYHATIYLKAQNSIQEKDHKIFLNQKINQNLASNLQALLVEMKEVEEVISNLGLSKKQKK